ncbi:MAG TPA: contractile injection system tape measure protein [Draconibacterium sp.]|nr:contractile injection system tape measure protein [Draconibacterium sp.]
MYSGQKHIIEKVFIEVNTESEKEAHRINNTAGVYLKEKVFPILEELFDECDNGTDIIRFDRLNIDFSLQDWEDENALKDNLLENIRTQLNRPTELAEVELESDEILRTVEGMKQLINPGQNHRAAFLFFIENGYLPWYAKQEYISEITSPEKWKDNLANDDFLYALKNVLKSKTNAVKRLVLQFADEVVFDFVRALKVLVVRDTGRFMNFVKNSESDFRNNLFECLSMVSIESADKQECLHKLIKLSRTEKENIEKLAALIIEKTENLKSELHRYFTSESVALFLPDSEDEIRKLTNELIGIKTDEIVVKGSNESANSLLDNKPTIQNEEFVSDKKEPPFLDKSSRDILVKNAGLIILGPFLTTFLKEFNWLDKNGNIKKEARFKAVQSIHFLATGETSFFEGNLVFEKFLCGVPLSTPLPQKSLLNDEVLAEAENLLQQVIKNWPALKNTGPDGLRQLFLNRNGKLIKKERGYQLIIERKAQDILLDKLQWNISVMKLPWTNELVYIEW